MLFCGMVAPVAKVTPVPVPGAAAAGKPAVLPTDAMQAGIHSDIRASSRHKKAVSAVLHLKKESIGRKSNPTAFKAKKIKAFS